MCASAQKAFHQNMSIRLNVDFYMEIVNKGTFVDMGTNVTLS